MSGGLYQTQFYTTKRVLKHFAVNSFFLMYG